MYAVVETGGKQYRVAPGDVVKVEKLVGDPGTEVELGRVVAVSTRHGDRSPVPSRWLGSPSVPCAGASRGAVPSGGQRG